jgi:hypothetical protein
MQISNPPPATSGPARPMETAAQWLKVAEGYVRKMPPKTQAIAAGGAGALFVLVIVGITAAFTRGGPAVSQGAVIGSAVAAVAAPATTPESPRTAMSNIPSADDPAPSSSDGVPVVSVDSLKPVTTHGAPSKGNGRLSIVAGPGWCAVTVDGTSKGVTPLSAFELPAGTHKVDCQPPNGKVRTANVNVAEGTAAHYRFPLDE